MRARRETEQLTTVDLVCDSCKRTETAQRAGLVADAVRLAMLDDILAEAVAAMAVGQ